MRQRASVGNWRNSGPLPVNRCDLSDFFKWIRSVESETELVSHVIWSASIVIILGSMNWFVYMPPDECFWTEAAFGGYNSTHAGTNPQKTSRIDRSPQKAAMESFVKECLSSTSCCQNALVSSTQSDLFAKWTHQWFSESGSSFSGSLQRLSISKYNIELQQSILHPFLS